MQDSQTREVEDISIVTAVYNHEDTLADTLDSILMQQTSHRFHIYCLNDASTDRSGEVLAEYQSRHPDKITIFTSSKNQGSGKKSFIHHRPPVNGQYWCLLAGDDYWTSADKLEKQVAILEKFPLAVGCSCHTQVIDEQTGEESMFETAKQQFNLMDLLLGRHKLYVHPSGLLWRNIHLHSGFFLPPAFIDNDVSGDTIMLHLMLTGGGEIKNIPEVLSCYRMTGRGVWTKLSREQQDAANREMPGVVRGLMPRKYRVSRYILRKFKILKLKYILPQPLNY